MKMHWLVEKTKFVDFDEFSMTNIIINLITFYPLVWKLWNNDSAHYLIEIFPTRPKMQWGDPWFGRVKVWSQNKTNTYLNISNIFLFSWWCSNIFLSKDGVHILAKDIIILSQKLFFWESILSFHKCILFIANNIYLNETLSPWK
jgi:hypothetical protein